MNTEHAIAECGTSKEHNTLSTCPAGPEGCNVAVAVEIRIRIGVAYLRVHLSSPLPPPVRLGLALRPLPPSRFEGSQPPPPPWLFGGWSRRSRRWPWRNEETSSLDARRKCIKLQKPPRLHSPFSFCRQQASRKSVTGESSAYSGRPEETINPQSTTSHKKKTIRTSIPAIIQIINCSLRLSLPFVTCIHVAYQMISDVVTHLSSVTSVS